MSPKSETGSLPLDPPRAFYSRELSWLRFARRVIAMAKDPELPLLERVKFAGIAGALHDEFFMKRMSGLKRQIDRDSSKVSIDGRTPREEFDACREELIAQAGILAEVVEGQLRPQLAHAGAAMLDHDRLGDEHRAELRAYFKDSVLPILTPLAVDSEHPFPFISNLGLNLAVLVKGQSRGEHFLRIKVPNNRPRWVPLADGSGFVPLEQVIAANLDLLYPEVRLTEIYAFRVTRGAEGATDRDEGDQDEQPGSIIQQVTKDLKARRFAGVVRLQLAADAPKKLRKWLARQLELQAEDIYEAGSLLSMADLLKFEPKGRSDLRFPPHEPVHHPRLVELPPGDPAAIFNEIGRGDLLLHHPYHSFDSSILRFIESAAVDPQVLAIKLTIYRTSADSPIIRALAEAARRGKQVAVLVEVTARFDEAPNIAWGKFLENEGVHVAYGVESLKTHVKLGLVVREEQESLRRYAHVGTGNYHSGTARLYEDMGVLTSDPDICDDVAAVFNTLTGATAHTRHRKLLVAPVSMRSRFKQLIRREAEHAKAGRKSGIYAKMNQLQDPEIIRELYAASRAGVPIVLNVRGLCCLRPGVKGLSDNIRLYGLVGRFLEHSRLYRFANDGKPEHYFGSADWMKRNLSNRVETVVPILDPSLQRELDEIIEIYDRDNASAWDCDADCSYERRRPADGEPRRAAQETFIALADALRREAATERRERPVGKPLSRRVAPRPVSH